MTWIRWDAERGGLEGLPAEFVPVARDALGDVLAHDASGAVFCFPHGTGTWQARERAFASLEQLRSYVEFQGELEIPESLDLLHHSPSPSLLPSPCALSRLRSVARCTFRARARWVGLLSKRGSSSCSMRPSSSPSSAS